MKLKFQTVAEKTAKNFRGLLYFAAPGRLVLLMAAISNAFGAKLVRLGWSMKNSLVVLLVQLSVVNILHLIP